MSTEKYMIDDAGRLFREGKEIGKVEGDALTLHPDFKNYQASVTRWINSKAEEQEGVKETPIAEPPAKALTPEEQAEADNKGIAKEAQAEAGKARAAHLDDVEFAKRAGIERPPQKNPQFGDKTPAYVEWLKKHRPDVFKVRFGVKGKGQVPVVETDGNGIDQIVGYREADMAARKTHLTEKVETNRGLGEDMDWDA